MHAHMPTRRVQGILFLALVSTIAASLALFTTQARSAANPKPTIVLVHGAFADASSWGPVATRLQQAGYTVLVPANPLSGVTADADYLKAYLATIKGPIVLVGHSYGGFVITNAAVGEPNVKALVYVAAYAPDSGDSVESLEKLAPGGMIGPTTLDVVPVPSTDGGSPTLEATIKQSLFREIFADDLPAAEANEMAVSQRPAALDVLGEPSGTPAWKTIPSWYVVPGSDNAIGTKVEQIMAARIHAHTTFVKGASHVVMLSHPQVVTQVIEQAAAAS